MACADEIDVYDLFFIVSVRGNMSTGFPVIFEKSLYKGTNPLSNLKSALLVSAYIMN